MKEGEEKKRKGKERKGKERDGGSGCRYQLEIRALFFFYFSFFVFPFWSLEGGGGRLLFSFSSPVNSSNYFSCLQGVVITLPTKRPKRPPKQSLKLGVGTREKVWGEGSNRRIEGEGEGEKEKVKSAAATMIDRLGGFRREVRRWMEKGNTGDDREAGELDSS